MDFAEFFTQHAREIVPIAWRRGLLFLFDYRGPFVGVEIDEERMRQGLERLTHAALELLEDGFIFMTAQTDWSDSGLSDLAISIAGTGRRASDEQVAAVLQRLRLVEQPSPASAAEGSRVASGMCPATGATLSFAANRTDGLLFAMDMTLPATLLDVQPMPTADGARAWLIAEVPGTFQSLVRRLQRLGWATSTLSSPQQALERLQQMKPGMARPSLVIGAESAGVTAQAFQPLRDALPERTQFVLATALDSTSRDDVPGVERVLWPFSPAELMEITRRARNVSDPSSGETMPAPLSFRDRPHALVVDDNAVNLLVASGLLQVAGFEVETAGGGAEAIGRCRAMAPQLVLMDIHMPGMDGLETTRVLRQMQRDGALPHFVIVAATADAMVVGEAACREAGMDGYLSKPLSLHAIEQEIDRLLPGLRRSLAPH